MKSVFGPINSRRFGRSLGIDLSPGVKQCNFDCLYCELAAKKAQEKMIEILPVEQILNELHMADFTGVDVLTVTANGEPTLYPHLYELIGEIKKNFSIKTLILSNGSRFGDEKTRAALLLFDIVKFSFDAGEERSFSRVDRPHKSLNLARMKDEIAAFSRDFRGQLVAEILFVKGVNDGEKNLKEICEFFSKIHVDRIDLGTIDRPPAHDFLPVSHENLKEIAEFLRQKIPHEISLPMRKSPQNSPQILKMHEILEILERRPLEVFEAKKMLGKNSGILEELLKTGEIFIEKVGENSFYRARV